MDCSRLEIDGLVAGGAQASFFFIVASTHTKTHCYDARIFSVSFLRARG